MTTAAAGLLLSYGNQIGLATGQVNELYHPGYAAKRMEIGAVVGAAPAANVRRERPAPGDVIVLLGGRTGRDGMRRRHRLLQGPQRRVPGDHAAPRCRRATPPWSASSSACSADSEACRLIKRCNDFGAGGVSVAVGELADGLDIDLNAVPKKYEGLDGTELAISESQERMAVALAPEDVEAFMAYAREENLEATLVATVTEEPRLRDALERRHHRGRQPRVPGLQRRAEARRAVPRGRRAARTCSHAWARLHAGREAAASLDDRPQRVPPTRASSERFDSTIGAATVLMPFGGKTPAHPRHGHGGQAAGADGETTTLLRHGLGLQPLPLRAQTRTTGAYLAVVESVSQAGGRRLRAPRRLPHLPGVLREAAAPTPTAGASPSPPCWAP